MALSGDERKRRPVEHVNADLSVNHVERSILKEGHICYRQAPDYGYDLCMVTFDEHRYIETGLIYWQLKASASWAIDGGRIAFDLDTRDFRLWVAESHPVILGLYDVSLDRCYWIHAQGHLAAEGTRPRVGAKTVRIWLPETQWISRRAIRRIRLLKLPVAGGVNLRIFR